MSTTEFLEQFKKDPLGFLRKNKVALQKTDARLPSSHDAYMHAKFENVQGKYVLTIHLNAGNDRVKVQYLPWYGDSGLYIELQSSPDIFVTAKLTGCDLAVKLQLVHENVHLETIRDDLDTLVMDAEILESILDDPHREKKAKELEIKLIARLRKHKGNPKFVELGERLERIKERHEQGLLHSIDFLKELLVLAKEVVQAEKHYFVGILIKMR